MYRREDGISSPSCYLLNLSGPVLRSRDVGRSWNSPHREARHLRVHLQVLVVTAPSSRGKGRHACSACVALVRLAETDRRSSEWFGWTPPMLVRELEWIFFVFFARYLHYSPNILGGDGCSMPSTVALTSPCAASTATPSWTNPKPQLHRVPRHRLRLYNKTSRAVSNL